MIRLVWFSFLLFSFTCKAQFHFVKQGRLLIPKSDSLYSLTFSESYSGEYDYFQDSTTQLIELIKGIILKENKNRIEPLKESNVLHFLTNFSLNYINSINEKDKEKVFRNHRKIKRVFYASRCSFGIISVYSFEIPIIKSKGAFYFDKNGKSGGFNLYKGKKLTRKQLKKGKEPIALSKFDYEEIKHTIYRNCLKEHLVSDLHKKAVTSVGVSVQLRKNTCYRNAIPKVRVVIILGEKRFTYKQRKKGKKQETTIQ